MKTISVFNNKGGVGKTTLTFHLGNALAELGHKTLIIDLDPQCNLTILGLPEETLNDVWQAEEAFIDDFRAARDNLPKKKLDNLLTSPRSIHFLLKPTEDGLSDLDNLSPPFEIASNLHLIPGRLTMHLYEDAIARRWSDVYQGDPLAVRTVTRPRQLAEAYAKAYGYEFVIMDTSPSLGTLNKVVISTADGFLIPCMPDMFSQYGIKNIGNSLTSWRKQFETIYHLLSAEKRKSFPENFVRLLGYTIYNAKKYAGKPMDLATAHHNFAIQIPDAIRSYISPDIRSHLSEEILKKPIGGSAIMHTHNTMPSMAQKYHTPMWRVPSVALDSSDTPTIAGNRNSYEITKVKYKEFAKDLLTRTASLD
ncbi:ParA family protein [Delftia acidovorans]|uniref:ParA family protein n=1 Tax=Delftia acidovorans TaxID=80866 RepID=A0AAJ2V9W2_DELAC|nr:ParA family protein [Delftia acidovorans]MDX4953807.1 ParA family protein [Delftia acidovorans]